MMETRYDFDRQPRQLSQYSDYTSWTNRVKFAAGAGIISPRHRVQSSSGDHPASYPTDYGASFSGGITSGERS